LIDVIQDYAIEFPELRHCVFDNWGVPLEHHPVLLTLAHLLRANLHCVIHITHQILTYHSL